MKAIVLNQPWASMVASGRKTIELRSWSTKHRGPIVICAGVRGWSDESVATLGDGPRGVQLCVVNVVDVRPATEEDRDASGVGSRIKSLDGLYAWVLEDPKPVTNESVRGMPGIFTLPR